MKLSANDREFLVPGKNIKVAISQDFERKELSGNGSGSKLVNAGNKPKEISVGTLIPESDKAQLRELFSIAEATTRSGQPVAYTVADSLCQLLSIRVVMFIGSIKITEASGLRAWEVSFTLRDVASTADKREERLRQQEVEQQPQQDGVVAISTSSPDKIAELIRK